MKLYSVRTLNRGKLFLCKYEGKYDIRKSNLVIIDDDGFERLGRVVDLQEKDKLPNKVYRIVKKSGKYDLDKQKENNKECNKLLEFAKTKAKELKLDMKFVKVESNINRSRMIMYFTSDNRVDFRELLKPLASFSKSRIELKQIGSRDEFSMFDGLGKCGRPLCCASCLNKLSSVTIKDVKEQGMQINMNKISGVCGKLMCCIKYEQDSYKENIKLLPKYNQEITVKKTKEKGRVASIDILNLKVRVKIENEKEEIKYETYKYDELEYKLRR